MFWKDAGKMSPIKEASLNLRCSSRCATPHKLAQPGASSFRDRLKDKDSH